jgi:hypothetical protein
LPCFMPIKKQSRGKGRRGRDDEVKAILRDHIKATVGFEKLGEATSMQPKSLIRMFGPRGNPQLTTIPALFNETLNCFGRFENRPNESDH